MVRCNKLLARSQVAQEPVAVNNWRMTLQICPLDEQRAREMVSWRYEPPYDVYNFACDEATVTAAVGYYIDPQNGVFAMVDSESGFIGFCSFGEDAKVGGGDYRVNALDIGMGIRPDMTGRGNGTIYASAAIDYAKIQFDPINLRIAVAKFNERAQKVWLK